MSERIRSTSASPCSAVIFSLETSLPTCLEVTSRALRRPASTYSWSTSLSRTGTSAAAITWAISPPMTPAPTTAALKTNMGPDPRSSPARPELDLRLALVGEARDGAAQRVGHRPAHEQQVDDRRERRA